MAVKVNLDGRRKVVGYTKHNAQDFWKNWEKSQAALIDIRTRDLLHTKEC
jgi:transposase-like protein